MTYFNTPQWIQSFPCPVIQQLNLTATDDNGSSKSIPGKTLPKPFVMVDVMVNKSRNITCGHSLFFYRSHILYGKRTWVIRFAKSLQGRHARGTNRTIITAETFI